MGRLPGTLRRGRDEEINQYEEPMYRHADKLDFEEAARLCDETGRILSPAFGISLRKAV